MVLREWTRLGMVAVWPVLLVAGCFSESCGETSDAETRLQQSVGLLAAEAMQGRGPGTAGIDEAAAWVAEQFAELGLSAPAAESVAAGPADHAWAGWQPFEMTLEAKLGPEEANRAELVGPAADGTEQVIPLELGRDYTPLAAGGSG